MKTLCGFCGFLSQRSLWIADEDEFMLVAVETDIINVPDSAS